MDHEEDGDGHDIGDNHDVDGVDDDDDDGHIDDDDDDDEVNTHCGLVQA